MNSRMQEIINELKAEGMSAKKAAFIADRMYRRETGKLSSERTYSTKTWLDMDSEIEELCRKLGDGIWTISEFGKFRRLSINIQYCNNNQTVFVTRKQVDQLDQVTIGIK